MSFFRFSCFSLVVLLTHVNLKAQINNKLEKTQYIDGAVEKYLFLAEVLIHDRERREPPHAEMAKRCLDQSKEVEFFYQNAAEFNLPGYSLKDELSVTSDLVVNRTTSCGGHGGNGCFNIWKYSCKHQLTNKNHQYRFVQKTFSAKTKDCESALSSLRKDLLQRPIRSLLEIESLGRKGFLWAAKCKTKTLEVEKY